MADPFRQGFALIDQCSNELCRVDAPRTHSHELVSMIGKICIHESLSIVDLSHCNDSIEPEMGADQKRLRICITDASDADVPGKVRKIFLEAGTERRIGDGMNFSGAAAVLIQHGNPCASGPEMTVIICTEKYIQYNVAV